MGFSLLLFAGPAGASLSPECTASGVISGDDGTSVAVDAESTERYKIPRAADVDYEGSITVASPSDEMPYSGGISLDVAPGLDLIPGLDDPTIETWSWGGDTDKVSTADSTTYDLDLPAGLLGGLKATASGSHTQAGTTCSGSIDVEIAGSAVNAASLGSAAVSAAAAAGLGLAARGKP